MAKIRTAQIRTDRHKAGFMEVIAGIWMVAITAVMPLFAFKTRAGIRRYIVTLAVFVTALRLVGCLNTRLVGTVVMGSNEIVNMAAGTPALTWTAAALWCATAVLFVYDVMIRKYPDDTPAHKALSVIWKVILTAGIIAAVCLLIYANTNEGSLPAGLEAFRNYLVISDEWGTWRGYVWRYLLDIYSELPVIHKIFSTGPETASIYLFNNAYFDVAQTTGMLYDTPHNEWLMMLFNLGPFGLLSYLGMFAVPVFMAFRSNVRKYYPVVMAVGFVCICHLAESFINITALMELPVIFALMAMARSFFRSKE